MQHFLNAFCQLFCKHFGGLIEKNGSLKHFSNFKLFTNAKEKLEKFIEKYKNLKSYLFIVIVLSYSLIMHTLKYNLVVLDSSDFLFIYLFSLFKIFYEQFDSKVGSSKSPAWDFLRLVVHWQTTQCHVLYRRRFIHPIMKARISFLR